MSSRVATPPKPILDEKHQKRFSSFWPHCDQNRERIFNSLDADQRRFFGQRSLIRDDVLDDTAATDLERRAIVDGQWTALIDALHEQGKNWRTHTNPLDGWNRALRQLRSKINEILRAECSDLQDFGMAIEGASAYLDTVTTEMTSGYLAAKERLIADQQEAIEDLSAPILQIEDRLLVVALVGIIDSARAQRFTEKLLHAIQKRRAGVVVIDITGVPMVDTGVANHLVNTVDAAGLMGADVILTGISPDTSQTLVRLGATLPDIQIARDLQDGLEDARQLLDSQRGR